MRYEAGTIFHGTPNCRFNRREELEFDDPDGAVVTDPTGLIISVHSTPAEAFRGRDEDHASCVVHWNGAVPAWAPHTAAEATMRLETILLVADLTEVSRYDFLFGWGALTFLYAPHPDEYHPNRDPEYTGCRRPWHPLAEEAWRRADAGELSDSELYAIDAAKVGSVSLE